MMDLQFLLDKIKNFFNPSYLGVSVEGEQIHIALIKKERGVPCIIDYKTFSFLDKEAPFQALSAFNDIQPRVVTGLQTNDVVFRLLTLPLKGKRRILAALPFQLEALLPFSPEEAIVYPLLKSTRGEIAVIATSKTLLKQHLGTFQALNITPDIVTSTPLALFRLAQYIYPQHKQLLVFYFGEDKTSCIVICDGKIALAQSIRFGKSDCIQALKTAFPEEKSIDALFCAEENSSLKALKQKLQSELDRLSLFLKEKSDLSLDTACALFGEKAFIQGLRSTWAEVFPSLLSEEEGKKPTLPKTDSSSCLSINSLALGFALDALAADSNSQQLLQKEFIPAHHLRPRKKKVLLFLGACIALSALFALNSSLLLHKKTKALCEKYLACFSSAEKRSLSLSEMESALLKAEQSLGKQKKSSPFFLTLPNVSEVLAWLSMHPSLITGEGIPKEGIDIKNVHYQLIKFPTLDDPSVPYHAQVELEFTATTPRLAREFHELLLKGDRIVNAKKEIKWHAQGNRYTVQFELNKKLNL